MTGCSHSSYCIASRGWRAERALADHTRLAKSFAKAFDSKVPWEGDNLLEVTDLAVAFASQEGRVQAVDGISFGIREGETVGLVGESGCGKSISALAILGLVRMMSNSTVTGKVEFMGRDLLALPEHEVRRVRGRDISMIFQDPVTSLNPVLSIERQTTEGMENHLGLSHSDAVKRAIELLEMVGIPKAAERIHDYPHQFSGGMRQRVMIAIALSCNPKLLLADEPTTALDVTIQAQILRLMKQLSRDYGSAIILITHDLGVVAGMTERILVMYAGRIVESASAGELFAHPHHPYTVGLLRSVPRLDEPRKGSLQSIDGLPPDLAHLPAGCAFAARCELRTEQCRLERPPLAATTAGRLSACFHADQLVGAPVA
jgi:oligopeptide/dipeptide ABC transporter ATP-binding protein